ncbi:hypothetical protein ACFXHK_46260, partial [Embleya sp. NPDC059267]
PHPACVRRRAIHRLRSGARTQWVAAGMSGPGGCPQRGRAVGLLPRPASEATAHPSPTAPTGADVPEA